VSRAIRRTAGTVTAAAIVMVAVFSVFATLSQLDLKQAGFGLAVAILLDATVIRGVLLAGDDDTCSARGTGICRGGSNGFRGRPWRRQGRDLRSYVRVCRGLASGGSRTRSSAATGSWPSRRRPGGATCCSARSTSCSRRSSAPRAAARAPDRADRATDERAAGLLPRPARSGGAAASSRC